MTQVEPTIAPTAPPDAPSRTRRRLAIALALGVIWVVVLFAGWAARPLSDSMVVGFSEQPDGSFDAVVVRTECNTLFAGSPRDLAEPLPTLDAEHRFERTPCTQPYRNARIAFGLNLAMIAALLSIWILVFRAWRRGPQQPLG